jgi:hypothetical protein
MYVHHKDDAAPSSPMRSSTDAFTMFQAIDRAPILPSSGSWFTGSAADGEDGGGAGWEGGRGGVYREASWLGGVAGDVYGRFLWRARGGGEEWEWDGIGKNRPNEGEMKQAHLGQYTNDKQLNICANSAAGAGFVFSGIVKSPWCEEGFKTCTDTCHDTSSSTYRHAAPGDGGGRGGGSAVSCPLQHLVPEVSRFKVLGQRGGKCILQCCKAREWGCDQSLLNQDIS